MVTTSLSEVTCPEQLRLSCCEVWQPRQLGTAPCKVHIGNLLTHAGRLLHIKVLDFDLSHYLPSLKELRTTQTSESACRHASSALVAYEIRHVFACHKHNMLHV